MTDPEREELKKRVECWRGILKRVPKRNKPLYQHVEDVLAELQNELRKQA